MTAILNAANTRIPAIDIHFHAIPPGFVDAARRGDFADVLEIAAADRLVFHAPAGVAVEPGLAIRPRAYDAGLIRTALDGMALDMAAASVPPEFFLYWAPAAIGAWIAAVVNDGYAEWARAYPDRFCPLATVPLQDPDAAATELHRAVDRLGLRGVAICSHVNGIDLDHPRFAPFWRAAEDTGVPVFIHPQNSGDMARLADHHLWNLIGFPFETATTAARLILSGTLARHPRLRIILAHGGGFFPYQIGRLDHGWRARPALQRACPAPPSHYLRQIWCDSLVHDPASLRFLVERFGDDHVVLGTDHPFDMGDPAPLQSLARAGLPDAAACKITGSTVAGLLQLG
jgi:aminocarboxymuconate-semialdehyde decarboxylase